ncbi:MAG: Eco47II family restriction endonuclease, partial [Vampirovibrionales bacterium]
MWPLDFISKADFHTHVQKTIEQYGDKLQPFNLQKFNSNIVDPIKLIFDKTVYNYSWEEVIKHEIFRQRDKSNNNDIGYFHQDIFQYIQNCSVPQQGWDVIYQKESGIALPDGDTVRTVYVEMKNKHNTMNSSSSAKTYINMQSQLLANDHCACFLVEAIAKRSQNVPWAIKVDNVQKKHKRIRRVSMDEFYALVTGNQTAFYDMCMVLPDVIQTVVGSLVQDH